jgi:hypothetical protein
MHACKTDTDLLRSLTLQIQVDRREALRGFPDARIQDLNEGDTLYMVSVGPASVLVARLPSRGQWPAQGNSPARWRLVETG